MTRKAPDAFRTISEAADELDLPQHVLRHWEESFGAIRPMRRAGGRRYYRLHDIELLNGVKTLLHGERYTTKGVQKIFKDQGAAFVAAIGRLAMAGEPPHIAVANAGAAINTEAGAETLTPDEKLDLKKLHGLLRDAKREIASIKATLASKTR